MSNIRTLKDLESGPNKQALPNPWNQSNQVRQSQSQNSYQQNQRYSDEPFIRQQQSGGGIQYVGVDGYRHALPAHEIQQNPVTSCCLMCCPCVVDPCGSERRQEWVRLCKSFMFVVSVLQIIMFIVELSLRGFTSPSNNPMLGPPTSSMIDLGAKDGYRERHDYEVYRFFVPIFLHAGILHIAFNIWAQLRYGLILEREWGIPRTMIIYFLSGIGGCLFSSLIQPHSVSVGASGAIMGLLGANLAEVLCRANKYDAMQRKISIVSLIFIISITMIFSSAPFIDWSAHLGGVIMGFLLGLFIFVYDGQSSAPKFVAYIGLGLAFVYFVLGFALFYTVVKV